MKAQKCWLKMSEHEKWRAFNSLKLWKQTYQWQQNGGMYIPHGSTFLFQKRYDDEPWTGAFDGK
jgi:hypothetical protein